MARRVFYSFDFGKDAWRVSQIKSIGVVSGQKILHANEWETVKRGGAAAIKRWIDQSMKGRGVVVVLIGERTARRRWVKYEIKKAWEEGKALLGVYVHRLKDGAGTQSRKGPNPFSAFTVGHRKLSGIVNVHLPPYQGSKNVYSHIEQNLSQWVDEAVAIRRQFPGSRV